MEESHQIRQDPANGDRPPDGVYAELRPRRQKVGENHTGSQAVNLGTGKGTSVLEIVHAFEKACGHEIPYQIVGRRAGDIATCYADASKAKELLGWEATRGIEEMCRSSWNFIQKNPNGLQ